MKRADVDRALSALLERIDGELAEVRDGLVEVDHKYRQRIERMDARIADLESVAAETVEVVTDGRFRILRHEYRNDYPGPFAPCLVCGRGEADEAHYR